MTDFVKLCLEMGVDKAEEIPMDKLVFQTELRALCEQNACGKFGSNYKCPPHVGEINALVAEIKRFSKAVIWQTISALEDSFDFEGMMEAQRKHNAITRRIAEKVYAELGRENVLALAAGSCELCSECAAPLGNECRRPAEALAPLEAYGINVSKIAEVSELKYINGANTVTYFSGVFFD